MTYPRRWPRPHDRTPALPEPIAPGRGVLRAVRRGPRTIIERAYASSPLRLLTPRNHGNAAWVYTSSFGGGLVDGDAVSLDVDVDRDASLFVSTQASTKVYRSTHGSSARLTVRVADRGLLVLAPDPVVCFAESRFEQHQTFDVASDGRLVVIDWVTSGRRESGERWAFTQYVNRLVMRLDDTLIVHEALALRRQDGDLAARLGRFDVLAVVVVLGAALAARAAAVVQQFAAEPVERRAAELRVATPLVHPRLGTVGCLVRIAGRSVEDVGRTIRSCLQFVPDLLGDDPWARKW